MNRLLIEIIVGGLLLLFLVFSVRTCTRHKEDSRRWEQNTIAMNGQIEYYKTESGNHAAKAKGLQISINSLEDVNSELLAELEATKVELKNAKGVIHVVTNTEYINGDTIYIEKTDSICIVHHKDTWLDMYAKINLPSGHILPQNLHINIPNETTIVTEEITKRRWLFWRVPIGVQVTVVNSNPYIGVSDIFYVDLLKK